MKSSLFEHVAVFANSDGANSHTKEFIEVLSEQSDRDVAIMGLAEKLPIYTRFPAGRRKERIEALIGTAANAVVVDLVATCEATGISPRSQVVLEGRFPGALLDWIHTHQATLVVKESLPCDDHHGNASKGDIRLARHSKTSVLLAHAPIEREAPIIVAIAPYWADPDADTFWIDLVDAAVDVAKLFRSPLHVVHAWALWGENLIRSRAGDEECESELEAERSHANEAVERVMGKVDLQGIATETHLEKGSPTRVLGDAIDRLKPSLVVLGPTASRGPLGSLLGATAESLAIRKETSVLIVKNASAPSE